jgi:diaminopimelate epimerase
MKINFFKYQGTGNDFVILDNREGIHNDLTVEQVAFLCNRRFGIGADGLMLLNNHPEFDFEMKYFNADGRESSMCGNGGRCLVKFAHDIGMNRSDYKFLAVDGEHEASINPDGSVSLKMNDVQEVKPYHDNFVLNTGSPHLVHFTEDLDNLDVFKKGSEIRNNRDFEKEGINVNFVENTHKADRIKVRTYERGVENETYSCGTGVTASALVCFHNDSGFNHVDVETPGGSLSVEYEKSGDQYSNIWLIGPAEKVFQGTIELV